MSSTSSSSSSYEESSPSKVSQHRKLFERESSKSTLSFSSLKGPIRVFKHVSSSFRVIVAQSSGPITSATIVVPTLCENDHGLPHTLEHLVFCGSKHFPDRGYLDSLANRCLSTGTNAYTSEDHTAYEITTVGYQGMLEIIPVFLDHILHPTLREAQFMTEVYHMDADGKHQGVVYCEMASREHTEADLMDRHARKSLYGPESTYRYECGGLTGHIQRLTNADCKAYHERFYRLDNMTLIVVGCLDAQSLVDTLEKHDYLFEDVGNGADETKSIAKAQSLNIGPLKPALIVEGDGWSISSKTVPFPSSEDDVGSIAYAWKGPENNDLKTSVALDVLFRYLAETPASPFSQDFVERDKPFASQVDLDLRGFVYSMLGLVFSGVPYRSASSHLKEGADKNDAMEEEDDDHEKSDSDENADEEEPLSEEEEEKDSDEEDGPEEDLFEGTTFSEKVQSTIRNFVEKGFVEPSHMKATLKRHRRKIIEAFEENPQEFLIQQIIPDVTRYYLVSRFSQETSQKDSQNEPFRFGTRCDVLAILDQLEKESSQFWMDLAAKWLLNAPSIEIKMVPDGELASKMAKSDFDERQNRLNVLSKEDKTAIQRRIDSAAKENEVNLSQDVIKNMPPMPRADHAPGLYYQMKNYPIPSADGECIPFSVGQVVTTETSFVHLRLGFNIADLPNQLRPYLLLFQELLFQSPLQLPAVDGIKKINMDYRDVARYASEMFVSFEAAVGFGNELWTTAWLSDLFMMTVSASSDEWDKMIRFTLHILFFSSFTEERIVSIAKNLLSNLSELKRDGNSVMTAVYTRASTHMGDAKNGRPAFSPNDAAISMFRQEAFLKKIVKQCKNGEIKDIVTKLDEVRDFIITHLAPGFVAIGTPRRFSISNQSSRSSSGIEETEDGRNPTLESFLDVWRAEFKKYVTIHPVSMGKKRKQPSDSEDEQYDIDDSKKSALAEVTNSTRQSPFPFPRVPYNPSKLDPSIGRHVMVPISGLTASFLAQFVSCDVLPLEMRQDYFAISILTELLARAEGPLYTTIRGLGYAYGVSLNLYLWIGQLSFEVHDASDPRKALLCFYNILEQMQTEDGFNTLCSDFHIETARASVAYKWISTLATPGCLIASALRSSVVGYPSLKERERNLSLLYTVTRDDLKNVFEKYFLRFTQESERATVLVTKPGKEECDHLATSFKQMNDIGRKEMSHLDPRKLRKCELKFQQRPLNTLLYEDPL